MTFVLVLLSICEKFVSKSKIFNLFEEGDVYILSIESNDKLELGNLQKGLLHFHKTKRNTFTEYHLIIKVIYLILLKT